MSEKLISPLVPIDPTTDVEFAREMNIIQQHLIDNGDRRVVTADKAQVLVTPADGSEPRVETRCFYFIPCGATDTHAALGAPENK